MKYIFLIVFFIFFYDSTVAQQMDADAFLDGEYIRLDKSSGDTLIIGSYKKNIPIGIWKVRAADDEWQEINYDFDVKYKDELREGYTELPPDQKQQDTSKKKWIRVEKLPEFPGGEDALREYIIKNKYYPLPAIDKINGGVELEFTIKADGTIADIIIVKALHPALDKEAVRIIREMPTWSPALSRGEPVDIIYTIPVKF